MTFDEVLAQVQALLQQEKRVSYRGLKRRFALDDEYLEDLKEELIGAKRLATDEDGRFLVWTGGGAEGETAKRGKGKKEEDFGPRTSDSGRSSAERRQLTVMFCDLVGSTALSEQLDPEELREVVRAYQRTCVDIIIRYEGAIAQYLGDGVLVYFGYPVAHEDDAARAVRTGLEIISAIQEKVPSPLAGKGQGEGASILLQHLQVRIGIHTGLVVIGEIGSSDKREVLALGETPNIAARLQSLAEPNSLVVSAVTQRLVAGLFECQELGPQALKGITVPLSLYRVVRENEAQSRFEVAISTGLTPLVGRDLEVGLLCERWTQAKDGEGQVILLSGEPGIGKSRLVQTLTEHALTDGAIRIEFRCSAYHQNSAFYPILDYLQRLLSFALDDTPQVKLAKLQQVLAQYHFPQIDTFALLAALLSLPHPDGVPPLTLSPQKQKQKTQEALVAWIIEEAEKTAVYCVWEDLHWADPSTLEVLTLFLDQVPTARLLATLTFRPEFTPPWKSRSHISHLMLRRLGRPQVETMVKQVTGGKSLPTEVVQQIVAKTDGVPLFVEELTKTVLESVGSGGRLGRSAISLGIPATLQDALMARLDRLGITKEIAQVGAVLGREFAYEVLYAVSPVDEETLQHRLKQLVEAELVYQRGVPPQATYLFKHALIQDTAYQSLLKSTRQQYHQQIAQVLEDRFPDTKETQPELLAHHYTEAGLGKQAIPYWQKGGERARQRSAYVEAAAHLTKGLGLLKTLADTPERAQQELTLQLALGTVLMATRGYAAPEVEHSYARAHELCRQVGETPQLLPVLGGLYTFHLLRAELQTARELAEQELRLAQSLQDPALLLGPHHALGLVLFHLGELKPALTHLEQSIALYDPRKHRPDQFRRSLSSGQDPKVACLCYAAWVLWYLGYPEQARKRRDEALTLAKELSHPFSLAFALNFAAVLTQFLRDIQAVQEQTEALMTLSREHGFPFWLALGTIYRGWVLAQQGQVEEGIAQMRQGMIVSRATGTELTMSSILARLAKAYGRVGRAEEGLSVLAEALDHVDRTGERVFEAELYRLKGMLMLQSQASLGQVSDKFQASQDKSGNTDPRPLIPNPQVEAEAYFHKAIEIARKQQAKSLELRAATSLARLWQQQGKQKEAHGLLAEIYGWFTEGFDTKDLQEAKALIEELRH